MYVALSNQALIFIPYLSNNCDYNEREGNKLSSFPSSSDIRHSVFNIILHFNDRDGDIGRLYHVELIPTLVLISKEGKMIYKSDNKISDKEALPAVLETIN